MALSPAYRSAAAVTLLLTACPHPPDSGDTGRALVAASPLHNLQLQASLDCTMAQATELQDVLLSWDTTGWDLYAHTLPAVGRALVYFFPALEMNQVASGLVTDTLDQTEVGLYGFCEPDGTACFLSEFNLPGHDLAMPSHFEADNGTWLLTLTDNDGALLALGFFEPVAIGAAQLQLGDFACDLRHTATTGEPLPVPTHGTATLDFGGITHDVMGQDLSPTSLDTARLMRFDTPSDGLLEHIFVLPEHAAEVTEHALAGETSLELDTLEPSSTWLLGLYELNANLTAPKALLLLEPE